MNIGRAAVAAATVGETMFLRHASHFEWLTRHWLPERLRARRRDAAPDRVMRILSAPCASGEEPYSVVARLGPLMPPGWELRVVGIDISHRGLEVARRGRYGLWSMRGVDIASEGHWLRDTGTAIEVAPHVRDAVEFREHNMMHPLPGAGHWDLILCRNMLIYFHAEALVTAWRNLAQGLAKGGVILTAPTDPSPPTGSELVQSWQHGIHVVHAASPQEAVAPARPPEPFEPDRRALREAGALTTGRFWSGGPLPPALRGCAPALGDALPEAPPEEDPDLTLARVFVQQHDLTAAARALEQLSGRTKLGVDALVLQALVAGELGDTARAVEAARAAAFLDEQAPFVVFVLGNALEAVGHRKQAQVRYRWAQSLLADLADDQLLKYSEGLAVSQLAQVLHGRIST